MKICDFWQCPQCKERTYTLYGRERYNCPECYARCICISLKTYGKPDYRGHDATARIDPGLPLGTMPYSERPLPRDERDDPERRV